MSQRLLGFDYGRKRIGVASGQLVTGTASALETVRVFRHGPDWQRISELVAQWQPQRMVLGISRHADGTDSPLTPHIREFAAELTTRYGCEVETIDEYLSSAEARMLLEEGGATTQGDHLDALSAQLILQSWIDQQVLSSLVERQSGQTT